jgi:hypothetical protein
MLQSPNSGQSFAGPLIFLFGPPYALLVEVYTVPFSHIGMYNDIYHLN